VIQQSIIKKNEESAEMTEKINDVFAKTNGKMFADFQEVE
jgi:hypothetical protein